jgi:cytochrome c553
MSRSGLLWCVALGLVVAAALPFASARATDAATIASQGNGKGAAPCVACHGANGGGQATGNPRLAGLDAAYLRRQLDDFASGTRASPVMSATAGALDDGERQAIATYYSRLPVPSALRRPAATVPDAGAELATRGRWSKQVPGCVQCHGLGGIGVGANFPPLAGQPAAYIESQLRAWQRGTRHNDPLQLMQHLSAALSDQDIHDVAAWFAVQPVVAQGAAP